MPCLFLAHGTPMNALENNRWTRDWQTLASDIPRPDAVVVISAHWCSPILEIAATDQPRTIHDFGGFPPALFNERYPCPGSPKIAKEIHSILDSYNPNLNFEYGMDHGAWVPLKHLFPAADIPCLQLSLNLNLGTDEHYHLAKKLQPLRKQNILFIGSGNIVHNIPRWLANPNGDASWAREFDQAIKSAIDTHDHQAIINYPSLSADALDAVPHPDHFLPLVYILALSTAEENIRYSEGLDPNQLEDCCMRSVRFG